MSNTSPPLRKRKKRETTPDVIKELILYDPHDAQLKIHNSQARFRIVSCGRRFGKTLMAANEIVKFAWENPTVTTWWVAPVYPQATIGFKAIRRVFKDAIRELNATKLTITLKNGAVIEFKSAERPDNLRGEGLGFLVIDEASLVQREAWIEALRPALSDNKGRLIAIGTPKGKNWFFELWTRGQDPSQTDYESWKMSTAENPYIDPEEIDELRRTLPERVYKQEVEAEFLEGGGGVFRNVHECVRDYSLPLSPDKIVGAVKMGVDVAKYEDFTVIAAVDEEPKLVYFDRFNQIDWELQKGRIISAARELGAQVFFDSTGVGDPIYEDLSKEIWIESIKFTNQTKQNIINNLSLGIEQRKLTIPNIPVLINELLIYQYDITATGKVRMSAPAGHHDDCVIGLALAYWGLSNDTEPRIRMV